MKPNPRPVTCLHDLDTIRALTGPGDDTAVVADESRKILIPYDNHVDHHQPAMETS